MRSPWQRATTPNPTQFLGIRLPVTIDTCELIEERWANWSRQDPVTAIESQADNLRRLKAFYIDCGEKDQFNLLYGARRLVRRLNELGIVHRYEEFPDNHTGVDYRMDESLPFLAQALSGGMLSSTGPPNTGPPVLVPDHISAEANRRLTMRR
jgi:hypothetical protein